MGSWRERFQKYFAAAAFAEAGEADTAREMVGAASPSESFSFSRLMAAVTFAEADCPEIARGFLAPAPVARPRPVRVDEFLSTVGLGGVRVCYGLARM